jgi:hypothetical protein
MALSKSALLFERGLITQRMYSLRVLDHFVEMMYFNLDAWADIREALVTLPTLLLARVAEELNSTRLAGGGWRVPTVGAIGTQYHTASPAEAELPEALAGWLSELLALRISEGPESSSN